MKASHSRALSALSVLFGCLFGLSARAGGGTLFEDFEVSSPNLASKGSYAGAVYALASGNWWICAYTQMGSDDRRNGAISLRLRGNSSDTGAAQNMAEMCFDKPDGIGTVSYKYGSYASHSGGILFIEYSTNQGATWAYLTGSSNTVPSWTSAGGVMLSTSVTADIPGAVRIRIVKASQGSASTSVNIDDIALTDYEGDIPPTVVVTPPITTVEAGNTVTASVTAKDNDENALAVSVWSPDIASTDYTFANNVFTWLADATGQFTVFFAAEDSAGLATTNKLIITVNLPTPSAPTVKTAAGSILLSWLPVPGATGYSVQAYKLATEIEVFSEDFLSCTNRLNAAQPQNITTIGAASTALIEGALATYGLAGWSGERVFCAFSTNTLAVTNNMVKIGSSDTSRGWIQTLPMDLSGNGGTNTLTFHAGKWGTDRGSMDVWHITNNGVSSNALLQIPMGGLPGAAMKLYAATVTNGTANSMISFSGKTAGTDSNRFFLDDVRLFYVAAAKIVVPSSQITVDGTTARVSGLPPLSEYLCTVTATDGTAETVSPEVTVRTTAPTILILR